MLHFTCDYTLRIIVSLDMWSTNVAIKSYLLLSDYDIKNGLTVIFIVFSKDVLYLVLSQRYYFAANGINLFILHRAGNLVVPNVSTEVSDVSSSSGPVKLADLQRILNNLSSGPVGKILNRSVLPSISFPSYILIQVR